MLAYLILFCLYAVYSTYRFVDHYFTSNPNPTSHDDKINNKFDYLHIAMDLHCMTSTIAWLYVLFRLKRVEILMNPVYSTRKWMLSAI